MPWCRDRKEEDSPSTSPNSPGMQPAVMLVRAAEQGSPERLTKLLQKLGSGAVHLSKRDGTSALHAAAKGGHAPVCRLLIERGADTNKADCFGSTPLANACRYGHNSVTTLLLEHGARPNVPSHQGITPLMRACSELSDSHVACARTLLHHSADPSAVQTRDGGETALLVASNKGNLPCVTLLLEAGAAADAPADRTSALAAACSHGHVDCARGLIDGGAILDHMSPLEMTALMAAACAPSTECATLLLRRRAGIDVSGDRNPRALQP